MQNIPIIINAIVNGHTIGFVYKDEARILEPHTFGVGKAPKFTPYLSAYQYATDSKEPGWRLFDLTKVQGDISIIDGPQITSPRAGYTRGDSRMERIIAEV